MIYAYFHAVGTPQKCNNDFVSGRFVCCCAIAIHPPLGCDMPGVNNGTTALPAVSYHIISLYSLLVLNKHRMTSESPMALNMASSTSISFLGNHGIFRSDKCPLTVNNDPSKHDVTYPTPPNSLDPKNTDFPLNIIWSSIKCQNMDIPRSG